MMPREQAWVDFISKTEPIRIPLPRQTEKTFKTKKKYTRKTKHKTSPDER